MSSQDTFELLSRNFLFRDVDPSALRRVAELGIKRRLASGERLFSKGDDGDALYGVISGNVAICASGPGGKEVILSVMEPGDILGEVALIDGLPRTADARALEPADLLMIRRRDFLALLEREPKLSIHLLQLLCERLRQTNSLVEDAAFLSLSARLAKRLLSLATLYGEAAEEGVHIGLKLSQSSMARMLGTSRESVNKHLQEWVRAGYIDVARSSVTVKDREALQRIVKDDQGA
jgi:CRP-like cAMP-binding protein